MASPEASAPPPPMASTEDLSSQMSGMSVQGTPPVAVAAPVPHGSSVGSSPVLSMFTQGGVIVLQSVASGSTLCIYDGHVSGKGIRDAYSQFVVHVQRPGVIGLQSMVNPEWWLGVFEGKTLGSGNGGPYSEFNLREVEDKYAALESTVYSGQHVGILEDGGLKPPGDTPARDRASLFIPFPHSPATASAQGYPAATYPALPSESDPAPPPYPGPPTTQQPSAYGYQTAFGAGAIAGATALGSMPPHQPPAPGPPTLPAYQPPPHMPYHHPQMQQQGGAVGYLPGTVPAAQVVPSGPAAPVGYAVMDLFNRFNILTFIPKIDLSGRPMGVQRSVLGHPTLRAGSSFVSEESEFILESVAEGTVVMKNHTQGWSCGLVTVNDAKNIFVMKTPHSQGRTEVEFIVRSISGPVVAFESLKFPGHFVSIGKNGLAKVERRGLDSDHVQFTVRINRFNGHYSQVIMSPFALGTPSIINQLKDGSVVQLYHKPTMQFVCLVEGGKVMPSKEDNFGTFLIFRDRGMGRVSLMGHHKAILKLRMTFNGTLSSVGAEDTNIDFYVKENQNKTIQFESVPYPGKFVHLTRGKGLKKELMTEFSIYLLDVNRSVGRGMNKTIPKYSLN